MSGAGVFLVAGLLKGNARHALPGIADVARHAPEVATDGLPPLPDIAPTVLAQTEHEIAVHVIERRPHEDVRLLQVAEVIVIALIGAPVVLDVVESPLRPGRG